MLIEGWKAARPNDRRTSPAGSELHAATPAAVTRKEGSKGQDLKISERSFLSALLAGRGEDGISASGKDGQVLDDAEIVQQAFTFIIAG